MKPPRLYGRQVTINSYWLNDLKGRRIIGVLPENDGDGYFLLVEGGKKVRLAAGSAAYRNEQIGVRDINIFSINDLNIIENNPIYSYGIYFQPYEIFEDWQKVFQYAIAVLDVEWTPDTLQKVYELFLDFMKNQICEFVEMPAILEKEIFFKTFLKTINKKREYLCCKEDAIGPSVIIGLQKIQSYQRFAGRRQEDLSRTNLYQVREFQIFVVIFLFHRKSQLYWVHLKIE